MSKRFGALQADIAAKSGPRSGKAERVQDGTPPISTDDSPKAKARDGKKAIVGYFSEDLSRQLRMLAIEDGVTVQSLVGEALDMLLRARGKHPFGER